MLVPVDGSAPADAALKIATSIAGLTKAKLYGLYVEDERRLLRQDLSGMLAASTGMEPVTPVPLPAEEMLRETERLEEEATRIGELFSEQCRLARVDGIFLRKRGLPSQSIVETARGVDFVIMGNTGRHAGLEHLKGGLTTNALLHSSSRPVLVVPAEPEGEGRMVIAYDGSPGAERVLCFASQFAELAELDDVHLLTVDDDVERGKHTQQAALQYLSHYKLRTTGIVRSGRAHREILRYVDEVDPSVLAMGAFGANRIREKLFGSTTSDVLGEAKVAVLLME